MHTKESKAGGLLLFVQKAVWDRHHIEIVFATSDECVQWLKEIITF